jgi:hypothetical protein
VTNLPRAYNELVGLLLSEEDRVKFEWAIGSILSGGPAHVLIIHGDVRSGKSTLLDIARRVLLADDRGNLRVGFQHDGYSGVDSFYPDTFVFAATLEPIAGAEGEDGLLHISTTGERVSVNKHYVLMNQLYDEASAVSEHCIDVYRNGPRAVRNTKENNR